ncbi:MAG TPA: glycogen/starch/alpha-glucan phosphorylase, partial [Polyangiaceae bacterium]|nr:glycogen/starch/alpha-glucan phosphorylase [Polyangiaceae bacterium]
DEYMVFGDFDAYAACHDRAAVTYRETRSWQRMATLNIARIGGFSSDRTIHEYARDIWHAEPLRIPIG